PRLPGAPGLRPCRPNTVRERTRLRCLRATGSPAGTPLDDAFDGLPAGASEEDRNPLILSRRRARRPGVFGKSLPAPYLVHHLETVIEVATSGVKVPAGDLVV